MLKEYKVPISLFSPMDLASTLSKSILIRKRMAVYTTDRDTNDSAQTANSSIKDDTLYGS